VTLTQWLGGLTTTKEKITTFQQSNFSLFIVNKHDATNAGGSLKAPKVVMLEEGLRDVRFHRCYKHDRKRHLQTLLQHRYSRSTRCKGARGRCSGSESTSTCTDGASGTSLGHAYRAARAGMNHHMMGLPDLQSATTPPSYPPPQ
jgi:hypothetical protein